MVSEDSRARSRERRRLTSVAAFSSSFSARIATSSPSSFLRIPFFFIALSAASARAQHWPQWRGPTGDGVSAETGVPVEWSAETNVAWKTPLKGASNSTPIVWGDRLFITTQIGKGPAQGMPRRTDLGNMSNEFVDRDDPSVRFFVQCFSTADGALLWEREIDNALLTPVRDDEHNLASPSCVTDGERVYAWFGTGALACFDFNGNLVWGRHLGRDYGPFVILWGHGSSPALFEDSLILACEHDYTPYILAVDKRTGETRWRTEHEPKGRSYATPIFIQSPSGPEMILNASSRVDAYDPRDGKPLWTADGLLSVMVVTPVFAEGLILTTGGYPSSPIVAIRPGGRGNVTDSRVVWRKNNGGNYVPSMIASEGLLFIIDDDGFATAAELETGERLWRERLGGPYSASPVAAEGRIYAIDEYGDAFVFEAGRDFKLLGRNPLGERVVASPAIAGRRIYLRTVHHLYAIGGGN